MIKNLFFFIAVFLTSCTTAFTVPELAPPPTAKSCQLSQNNTTFSEIRLDRKPNLVLPNLIVDNQADIGSCYANSLSTALKGYLIGARNPDISYIDLMLSSPSSRPRKNIYGKAETTAYYESGFTCEIFNLVKKNGVCPKATSPIEMAELTKSISPLSKSKILEPLTRYYKTLLELPKSEQEKWLNTLKHSIEKAKNNSEEAPIDVKSIAPEDCKTEGPVLGLRLILSLLRQLSDPTQHEKLDKTIGILDSESHYKFNPQFFNQIQTWYPAWIRNHQQKIDAADFLSEFKKNHGLEFKTSDSILPLMTLLTSVFLTMDSYFDEETCEKLKATRKADRNSVARKLKLELENCPPTASTPEKDLAESLGGDGISVLSDKIAEQLIQPSSDPFQNNFKALFLPECESHRIPIPASARCEEFNSIANVKSELQQGRVVMASVKSGVFYSDHASEIDKNSEKSSFALHSIALIGVRGRMNANQTCEPEFLVHNSWGGKCSGYLGTLSKTRCNPDNGELWIPESLLSAAIYKGTGLPGTPTGFQTLK